MEQRISIVTLGVADLARAKAFYGALGWTGHEVEETVFYDTGSLVVVLWSRDKLAEDSGIPLAPGSSVALAHNVRSREDVDAVLAEAAAAGAVMTKAAAETFYGGYAGCFTDPDGQAWEVAHNPGFAMRDDGSLVLPWQ